MSNQELEIELLKRDKTHNEEKIKNMETRLSKLDDIYVRITRYAMVEKIVFTLTIGTLATVVGLIVKGGLIP